LANADHAESFGDQLDDALIKVAETIAECEQLAVGFWHFGSLRTIAPSRHPALRVELAQCTVGL